MYKKTSVNSGNETRLLSVAEACDYLGLGRGSGVKFARKIGAEIRIGKRCLYDKKVIDAHLDSLQGVS